MSPISILLLPATLALCLVAGILQASACSTAEEASRQLRSCIGAPEQVHFLNCLNEGSSCSCLHADGAFRSCLGPCAPLLLNYCGKDTPAKTWTPSSSKNIRYTAERPPLSHVDGVYVINLKRRPDRLEAFYKSSGFKANEVQVFEAVDGRALTLTNEIRHLFGQSDYKYHRGYISATLSHFKLWQHIAATNNEMHLVLEDDCIFAKDFIRTWNANMSRSLPRDAQLVYLGGMLADNFWAYRSAGTLEQINDHYARHLPTNYFQHDYLPGVDNFTRGEPTRRFFYTSIAYLISSNAARSLVEFINTHGFRKAADHTLYRVLQWTPNAYATTPLLVTVPSREMKNDSDVQFEANMLEDNENRGSTGSGSGGSGGTCAGPDCNFKLTSLPTRTSNHFSLGDIPTYVLTTESHLDRLRVFHNQALKAGVKHAPFLGVDGSQITVSQLQASGVLGASFTSKARGTAAVGVSHIMLWEQLADDKDASHYLVFEDDATVPADFTSRLENAIAALPKGWHMLNLGCPTTCHGFLVETGVVLPEQKCVTGLSGYLLSKEGADVLLSLALPLNSAIDDQIRSSYGTVLRAYCARPPVVTHNTALPQLRAALDA